MEVVSPCGYPILQIFEAAMGVGTAPQELELTTVYGRTLQVSALCPC